MAEIEKIAKKSTPPKGGRKGGTLFPKIGLKQALEYAKKLVAKTHTGPQPEKTVLPGVFGSATTHGKVRASALKQFGLLEGGKEAYQATQLAKDISAAPEGDRVPFLQSALLNSKLFKQVFDTFHGDSISKAKIKQLVQQSGVHPDSADECVDIFVDSAIVAGLGNFSGDSLTLVSAGVVACVAEETPKDEGLAPPHELDAAGPPQNPETAKVDDTGTKGAPMELRNGAEDQPEGLAQRGNKAGVTVNLNVDSSSDPDKLQKQLDLLKKYHLI